MQPDSSQGDEIGIPNKKTDVVSQNVGNPNEASSDPQLFGMQDAASAQTPRKIAVARRVLIFLFSLQCVLGLMTAWILYSTWDSVDGSGVAAIVPASLHILLLSAGIVLFGYYRSWRRKSNMRRDATATILLVASVSILLLVQVVSNLAFYTKSYDEYQSVTCKDVQCMSDQFNECALSEYTAQATVDKGLPDEAVATTKYHVYDTTEEFGCLISIQTEVKTVMKELEDGSQSQRLLQNQTLYCRAYPGLNFEQYIQEVLDNPAKHDC